MKKSIVRASAVLAAVLLASCASQTPEYRISMRPEVFERLSPREKDLVRRGDIAKGMDRDAVALAWGSPSARLEGLRDGKPMERWDYRGSKPVHTTNFYGGYGYGSYGPYRYSGIGAGFGPEITYIPYRKASVWFIGGRVDEWQRER